MNRIPALTTTGSAETNDPSQALLALRREAAMARNNQHNYRNQRANEQRRRRAYRPPTPLVSSGRPDPFRTGAYLRASKGVGGQGPTDDVARSMRQTPGANRPRLIVGAVARSRPHETGIRHGPMTGTTPGHAAPSETNFNHTPL